MRTGRRADQSSAPSTHDAERDPKALEEWLRLELERRQQATANSLDSDARAA